MVATELESADIDSLLAEQLEHSAGWQPFDQSVYLLVGAELAQLAQEQLYFQWEGRRSA